MARINIEDQFWVEYVNLAMKMGDQDKAIGQVVRFWKLVQEKHKHGKLITEDEFKTNNFSEHLFDLFAERTKEGITARGAGKHFDWLKARVESGRIGGSKPKQMKAKASKRKQVKASPSYSPSYSSSSSHSNSHSFENKNSDGTQNPSQAENPVWNIWIEYSKAYQDKYGTEPVKNDRTFGQIKQLLKRLGDDTSDVVKYYLTHDDPLYLKATHSIGPCLEHCESLRTQWKTGKKSVSGFKKPAPAGKHQRQESADTEFQNLLKEVGGS